MINIYPPKEELKEFILERGFPILIITLLFAFLVMWLYVMLVPRQYHYIDLDGVEHIENCIHTRASTLQKPSGNSSALSAIISIVLGCSSIILSIVLEKDKISFKYSDDIIGSFENNLKD